MMGTTGVGRVADAATVAGWIDGLGAQIAAGDERKTVTLVGVPRRGGPLADRLAAVLRAHGRSCRVVHVAPTMWRDDFDAAAHHLSLGGTITPSEIDGHHLVLVDDVLMTGRTIRAAMDHVMTLGRPSRVELAVLVDRGGREVPIQPDYVAVRRDVPREWRVDLRLSEIDGEDALLIDEGVPA